ncbi:membrane protein [Streptomyces minutiscleroticus]|uniref:Membrane protein n=1 Tax=Streptomyces minutiscleroticus TaxID=68238 RepID=A0A918NWN7_9ACTN|nr:ABC transporter permease [Streptomyces minutiscleroticus]GGY00296.1 membrane protein [Streptomyces minutiscleroticus]
MSPRASHGTTWVQDLAMGARFAVTGGREGWVRTALTALGVGLGVALLLFATAVPGALDARSEREDGRSTYVTADTAADDTLLVSQNDSTYRDENVYGRLVRPEGPKALLPPGLSRLPGPGEMMVSPALAALLDTPEGERLLGPRLPYERVGTIAEPGLLGPDELAYWAGYDGLVGGQDYVARIKDFGEPQPLQPWDPVLLLLVLIVFIVLLLPVAVFVAAAVRFGGERRDRRLAALRLVGADAGTVRRVAAGEALGGALLGVLTGLALFFAGRPLAAAFPMVETGTFPSDIALGPVPALLVLVAVPPAAVAVTLLALRGVVIEPLGVVRTARPPRRRLWWRLLTPLAGLALLYPLIGQDDDEPFNQWQVTGGVVLLLIGVTALLPWLVERAVTRLGGGPVAWQLAVRRLQLSSGLAVRPVNGIAVAVAGAIALQSLFTGVQGDYTRRTGADLDRAQMQVLAPSQVEFSRMPAVTERIASARGVVRATSLGSTELGDRALDAQKYYRLTVGDCTALREIAELDSCADGDLFLLPPSADASDRNPEPGRKLYLDPAYEDDPDAGAAIPWTVPADVERVAARLDPTGNAGTGLLATPGALPEGTLKSVRSTTYVTLDETVPDVREHVRNAAARADPMLVPMSLTEYRTDDRFAAVERGLTIGSAAVLLLIGASLFVSQMEQLRERRKLLASLVAFGTRRRTLGLSVLWQTAVPIALGLALACLTGLALAAVLLRMVGRPVAFDWTSVAAMTGIGAGVVLLVTLLSLPPLWRMMRPDGLRTE